MIERLRQIPVGRFYVAIGAARWTRFAALAQTEFALQHRSPARALMLGVHLGLAASDPSVPRATCAAVTVPEIMLGGIAV